MRARRRRVRLPSHHPPPLAHRGGGEPRRVVVAADADPRFVPRHVVDAIRNRFADRVARKVIHPHALGLTRRLPLASAIREIAHQFLLLGVDGNHRLPAFDERGGGHVDVLELRVTIRVRRAFPRLLQRVQPIAEAVQQFPDRRRADRPALRGQGAGQLRGAAARRCRRDVWVPFRSGNQERKRPLVPSATSDEGRSAFRPKRACFST